MTLIARLRAMAATGWNPIGNEAADEVERLHAALAKAEKDAARYRWLRQGNGDVFAIKDLHHDGESTALFGEDLDEALDAEIALEQS